MKNFAFTFDDVCIPPQRQIGLHSHPCWELSHVVCGAGVRTIGDHSEPFSRGEVILIPPGIPHVWRFDGTVTDGDGNVANLSVFWDPGLLPAIAALFPEVAPAVAALEWLDHAVSYQGECQRSILRLLKAMRGITPQRRLPMMIELIIALSDVAGTAFAGRNTSLSRAEQRLEQVRVYCACNYARCITLDEMSRHVGMNKSAFCTFMRHSLGTTFSDYLNGVRLERARDRLLASDCSVSEIALDCGFRSVTYFNRLFRRKYGCSPKEVRSAMQR